MSAAEHDEVVERFLSALESGDLQGLLGVLAPDVVLVADGGGIDAAIRQPIEGSERVARLLAQFASQAADARIDVVTINGTSAIQISLGGAPDIAVCLTIANARITQIHAVRNPHKLRSLGSEKPLTRQ